MQFIRLGYTLSFFYFAATQHESHIKSDICRKAD